VLDNCRLDYVYEPDWARLIGRTSRLLAQGKVVGWFQGPMGFGSTTSGSRSVLADPSGRYVRQNMNEYLRNVPVDEPLPVAFAPSQAHRCIVGGMPGTAGAFDVEIAPACRESLGAATDARGCVRVRSGELGPGREFLELLELHHRQTGNAGLIEIDLASVDEPVACTPRDAVRTMFSSAIDALVIGRFVLMKDYWLLRSHAN
jgi:carbamoyltransferase